VNVVAMVKIEDQIKTIDVQEELKSENNKDKFFNKFFLYKKLIMIIKIFNSIKSKILPYRFILFSIVFLGFILIKLFEHIYPNIYFNYINNGIHRMIKMIIKSQIYT
jgi:hypothetical protein